MIRIAITGGIACGKSQAGQILQRLHWGVCEADQVAHELYMPAGEAYEAVRDLAGSDAVREDGVIDRAVLGAKVFSDAEQLATLNQILHPLVKKKIHEWLLHCERILLPGAAVIVPLLFESGMEKAWDLDAIICMGSKPGIQRQRLLQRGLDRDAIEQRILAQWPIEKKMEAADFRLWNDGTKAELEEDLSSIVRKVSERK